jgi:hypothetical protein
VPKDNTLRPPRSDLSKGSERGCFTPSARYKDEEFFFMPSDEELFFVPSIDTVPSIDRPHPELAPDGRMSKDA